MGGFCKWFKFQHGEGLLSTRFNNNLMAACSAGEYTIPSEILYSTALRPNELHSDARNITLNNMVHYVNNNKILGIEVVFTPGAGWRWIATWWTSSQPGWGPAHYSTQQQCKLLMKHCQTLVYWFCQHMYMYLIADKRYTCELSVVRNIHRYIYARLPHVLHLCAHMGVRGKTFPEYTRGWG